MSDPGSTFLIHHDLADLWRKMTMVFLAPPPNRMDACSRWLRPLVSETLQDIARDAGAAGRSHSAQEVQTGP